MIHIELNSIDPHYLLGYRWLLDKKLGEGGQGEVWSAYDCKLILAENLYPFFEYNIKSDYYLDEINVGQINTSELYRYCVHINMNLYALKILTRSTKKALLRLKNEVEALIMLSAKDSKIVRIHDHYIPDSLEQLTDDDIKRMLITEKPYFVMDYIKGKTLRELATLGTWQNKLIYSLSIIRELALIVGTAHNHSPYILHRDLHPLNVFVKAADDALVLTDFGLCHIEGSDRQTGTYEPLGARFYIPYELEQGKANPSPASDIFSLGKILYFLISGGVDLPREDHRENKYADLLEVSPQMEFVYRIFDAVLKKDMLERPQSIEEFVSLIDNALELITEHYYPLKEGRKCIICGEGQYKKAPDEYKNVIWKGGSFSNYGNKDSYLLICYNCGNVQHFYDIKVARKMK